MHISALEAQPGGQFDNYHIPPSPDDGSLQGRLLLAVGASGRLEDHFRVVFGGGQQPTVSFNGDRISDHPAISPFKFRMDINPDLIAIKTNSFVSKWEDLEAMVGADRIIVSSTEDADAGPTFREGWEAAKKSAKPPAAAIRWSAQANPAYGFKLALQALPATARTLRKDARLAKDTTRTVEVAAWTASSPMAKEGGSIGPIPIIFTPDAAATRANLTTHPERLSAGNKFVYLFESPLSKIYRQHLNLFLNLCLTYILRKIYPKASLQYKR